MVSNLKGLVWLDTIITFVTSNLNSVSGGTSLVTSLSETVMVMSSYATRLGSVTHVCSLCSYVTQLVVHCCLWKQFNRNIEINNYTYARARPRSALLLVHL